MQSLICPACGAYNSEFDSQCAACGAPLATLIEGVNPQGPPRGGGGNRKVPPAGGEDQDSQDGDELRPGQEISHFRILGRLGRGGMGTVYRALDLELNREVALKFLRPERQRRSQDLARFQREAEALAKLDHPNIGTIYQHDQWQGQRFIVMALYDGETLAEHLAEQREHRLPISEAIRIASQLASALQAAHGASLVHRDLKPENVIILRDGWVKLIDFGLALWAGSPRQTEKGMVVGTLLYMAPEQIRSEEAIPQTDLWALGVVLYEMLAGRHPFRGKGQEIGNSILYEEPFPLRKARPQVPMILEKIVERCLLKEIKDRWASAADVLAELQVAGASGSGVANVETPRAKRSPWYWPSAAAAILLLGLVGYMIYVIDRTNRPLPRSVTNSPMYVAILRPVVSGSLNAAGQGRVLTNLKASLLRTVQVLTGLAASQSDQFQASQLEHETGDIARTLAADEIVFSRANCAADLCQITLSRLDGRDGRVEWTETLNQKLPSSKPRAFAEAVASSLRKSYGDHKLRAPRVELDVTEEDYGTYLDLRRLTDRYQANPRLLDQLEALRQREPAFLDLYSLEAQVEHQLFESGAGDSHNLDRGIAVAQQALERAPRDLRPLLYLFELLQDAHKNAEAETALQQLAPIDPAESLLRLGLLASLKEDHQTELRLIAEATHIHPSSRLFTALANHEYTRGVDDARSHFREVLRREPNNINGLKGLAQILMQKNPDRGAALYRRITETAPDADSFTNLGVSLMLTGRFAEAADSLRPALALKPADPSATLNLADCLLLLHRPEARQLYSQVITTTEHAGTDDWQTLSTRAQAFAHLGEKRNAVETILSALRVAPKNDQLAYEAALVYAIVGELKIALVHAQRAAAGGLNAFFFKSPFLDPLRHDPDFQKLAPKE
jgi:serine/threonine protein kinase/Flp pilus assembly protein TadD